MRRTLTVLVTAAAFLVPAAAASAAEVPAGSNASCSNGKGGNLAKTHADYNGKGNATRLVGLCLDAGSAEETPDEGDAV